MNLANIIERGIAAHRIARISKLSTPPAAAAAFPQNRPDRKVRPFTPVISSPRPPTRRELQVLHFISEGKTNKEIAFIWGRSVKTVEKHRVNGMRKIHAHCIADVTRWCLKNPPPSSHTVELTYEI